LSSSVSKSTGSRLYISASGQTENAAALSERIAKAGLQADHSLLFPAAAGGNKALEMNDACSVSDEPGFHSGVFR